MDFEVMVMEIPKDEINDKLAYLARDGGNITKSFYEDFVIAKCIANVSQLLYFIHKEPDDFNLLAVREELMSIIIDKNPLFNPSNLYINKNDVIKTIDNKDDLNDSYRPLIENPYWNKSYYEEIAAAQNKHNDQEGADNQNENTNIDNATDNMTDKPNSIEELPFNITQKWWKRIGKYIPIRTFSHEHKDIILNQRAFHDRSSFYVYIVSVCLENFEDLSETLDSLGIPNRVPPPILMHELYGICLLCNPFLTFENVEIFEDEDGSAKNCEGSCSVDPNKSTMSQYANTKPTMSFKNVDKKLLLKLGDNIKKSLIGQEEAIDVLTESIQRASVGLKDPDKPIGSFLFAGRTGVGKALATKVLADNLIKSPDNLITVDCSEYTADHEYSKLIGAPAGYVGHEQGGMLTNALSKNPFRVVVFDEVEKASHKVHELLLQVLEEGRLTDGKGKTVSFRDAVVILTSNIGVKEIEAIGKTIGFGDASKLTDSKKDKALTSALKKRFKPEFINRIDSIVNFKLLTKKDYMKIIDLELKKLKDNLEKNDTEYRNLVIKFDSKLKKFIYDKGVNEEFGARPLKRCIEKYISTPLARNILVKSVPPDSVVNVSVKKEDVIFDIKQKIEGSPFYLDKKKKKSKNGA